MISKEGLVDSAICARVRILADNPLQGNVWNYKSEAKAAMETPRI